MLGIHPCNLCAKSLGSLRERLSVSRKAAEENRWERRGKNTAMGAKKTTLFFCKFAAQIPFANNL
jgi:hypothetical protein